MYMDRIRLKSLISKVVSAEEAASHITDGMTVGMSGFTRAGDAKVIPGALAERAKREPFKINLWTGASVGDEVDRILTEANVIARRLPFQADTKLRKAINDGDVMFVDQHLSESVEMIRSNQMGPVDVAVVEALAITEEGWIIPTTSVGNSGTFAILAEKVIIELNLAQPLDLEGLHDIYIPTRRPFREPIPIVRPDGRIGMTAIPIDPAKIAAIVITEKHDSTSTILPPDEETQQIAGHLIEFFKKEVEAGRLTERLMPMQSGIGTIANAVLHGMVDSPFHDLTVYSEVLQDAVFELIDAGKVKFASGCSITLSPDKTEHVFGNFAKYKNQLILRPQEMSNHPEVIRRLGLIAINTALEFDLYGNVNSTHVSGTHMMNGIGGSGDFARNAYLSVFVTKSIAKKGAISSVVPMVTHVDHTEHDVDILVTEQGLADLRGLAPRERAEVILKNCVHPDYREQLDHYYREALTRGGQTPHVLEKAYSWHANYRECGTMNLAVAAR
jgi:succinyl-CoA:acetate CoA-transferase